MEDENSEDTVAFGADGNDGDDGEFVHGSRQRAFNKGRNSPPTSKTHDRSDSMDVGEDEVAHSLLDEDGGVGDSGGGDDDDDDSEQTGTAGRSKPKTKPKPKTPKKRKSPTKPSASSLAQKELRDAARREQMAKRSRVEDIDQVTVSDCSQFYHPPPFVHPHTLKEGPGAVNVQCLQVCNGRNRRNRNLDPGVFCALISHCCNMSLIAV